MNGIRADWSNDLCVDVRVDVTDQVFENGKTSICSSDVEWPPAIVVTTAPTYLLRHAMSKRAGRRERREGDSCSQVDVVLRIRVQQLLHVGEVVGGGCIAQLGHHICPAGGDV